MADGGKATNTDEAEPEEPALTKATGRGLRWGEDVIYALVAITLFGCALVVLADTIYDLFNDADEGVTKAMQSTLDSLLIVFILVELLAAVRQTLVERKLVAEPFLLVGIIASIKEIVVVSAFAEKREDVQESMLEAGVLGGVVVGLAIATFLLRRKEREPEE
ncbi:MAG: phosphate-starvation-inducible PsiE family protein [Acidimicrobiales bacterium]